MRRDQRAAEGPMSRCTRGRWKTRTGGETRPRRRQRGHGRATAALQPTTGESWATCATCWRRTPRTPRTRCTICSTISGSAISTATNTEGDHARGPILRDTSSGDRQRSAPAPRSAQRSAPRGHHGGGLSSWTPAPAICTGGDQRQRQRQRPGLSFIGL